MDAAIVDTYVSLEFGEEKEILGANLYSQLIDDLAEGRRSETLAPSGGHAIDISTIIETVKLGAELFIAAYGIYEISKKTGSDTSKDIDSLKNEKRYAKLERERIQRLTNSAKEASDADDR